MIKLDFDDLWSKHIKPLQGQRIYTLDKNLENMIEVVNDEYLSRISFRTTKSQKISKKIFEEVYTKLSTERKLTRTYINEKYRGRSSSIIAAILCKLPNVAFTTNPVQLHYKAK